MPGDTPSSGRGGGGGGGGGGGALLARIGSVGASVEFSWAAGEAVLMPYLKRQHVPAWVSSLAFASNPCLGLYLQPVIGRWTDELGKRVPFVLGLALLAVVGLVALVAAAPLARWLGLGHTAAVAAAFVGFAINDIAHDCLLIPGRAMLDDNTRPQDRGRANSTFTGFQLFGRLSALLLGALPFTAAGLGVFTGADAHFNAMLTVSGVFLGVCTAAAVTAVDEEGARVAPEGRGPDLERGAGGKADGLEGLATTAPGSSGGAGGQPGIGAGLDLGLDPNLDPPAGEHCGLQSLGRGELALCGIQILGWVGIMAQSFFWTSWRGEVTGCAELASSSAAGVLTTVVLPNLNTRFGTANVWCCSELVFHALMFATLFCADTGDEDADAGGGGGEGGSQARVEIMVSGVGAAPWALLSGFVALLTSQRLIHTHAHEQMRAHMCTHLAAAASTALALLPEPPVYTTSAQTLLLVAHVPTCVCALAWALP